MMFEIEGKGLIVRTKLFLNFIAVAMGWKKDEVSGDQCFICRYEALF